MKNIKLLCVALTLAIATAAQATLFSYDFNVGSAVPDANVVGMKSSQSVDLGTLTGTTTAEIVNVNVRLNISGGYNGDLFGYLVLQSADNSTTTAILLNRVGTTSTDPFGYNTSGFNVTLSGDTTAGYANIHSVSSPVTDGSTFYLADGRVANPNTVTDATTPTAGLNVLNGKNANGTWTLYLADFSSGDTSTLVSWGLDISVVPEPVTWAIIIFGSLLLAVLARRQFRRCSI